MKRNKNNGKCTMMEEMDNISELLNYTCLGLYDYDGIEFGYSGDEKDGNKYAKFDLYFHYGLEDIIGQELSRGETLPLTIYKTIDGDTITITLLKKSDKILEAEEKDRIKKYEQMEKERGKKYERMEKERGKIKEVKNVK